MSHATKNDSDPKSSAHISSSEGASSSFAHVVNTKAACVPWSKLPVFEKSKQGFHIHKGVLSFWSDYYRGMLNGSFREAKEKTLTSDEDPYIFTIFESFCYTNQLTDGAVTKGTDLLFTTLVRLWIFGDRVIAPALQNMAMTALMEKSVTGNVVPIERVLYVYENTMPRSPLRRWFIDRIAHTTCVQSWLSNMNRGGMKKFSRTFLSSHLDSTTWIASKTSCLHTAWGAIITFIMR
ncbi:hypothetical protein D6C95_09732, partial [Aureobasidium pullulans]